VRVLTQEEEGVEQVAEELEGARVARGRRESGVPRIAPPVRRFSGTEIGPETVRSSL